MWMQEYLKKVPEDVEVIRMRVPIIGNLHFLFKNKCEFNDISIQEVISFFIEKFLDGDFDEEFGILADE